MHSQIEILNEDFLALPGTNGGNGTDTQIRFALATVDPDGNPTTGITRDCNTTWFNDNLDSEYWNELAWDPHNYLNLYTNTAGGSRGYVPFLPAAGPVGEPHDRVVVNWQAFGPGGPFPPHADGRTATHEIGHYLGLLHPYIPIGQCGAADPPGCYQSGDLICDTVVAEGPGDGCPIGAESCGSLDPIISYMDLTDDLCMEEFTLEQSRRLRCTLLHYRPDLYDVVETGPALMFDPAGLDFGEVAVGATSAPQIATLHNDGSELASGLAFAGLPDAGFAANTGDCGTSLAPGASCEVSVTFTPAEVGAATATLEADSAEGSAASLAVEGEGVPTAVVATPMELEVDPDSGTADGNGVFEPAELVTVAPAWRNDGASATELTGGGAGLDGPAGAVYSLVNSTAAYGLVAPGATASCLDTGDCYQMGLNDPATRPAAHWDATFEETLAGGPTRIWTLHIGDSFTDVPRASSFYPWIETLLHHGVTGGCGASEYCPSAANTRDQMPVFLLKALEGGTYTPPACTGVFNDVPCPSLFADWIEDLVDRGITAGCGAGNYCPANPVSRDQMAVFLAKTFSLTLYGP